MGRHWVLYLILESQLRPVGCVPLVVGSEYHQELRWKLAFQRVWLKVWDGLGLCCSELTPDLNTVPRSWEQ